MCTVSFLFNCCSHKITRFALKVKPNLKVLLLYYSTVMLSHRIKCISSVDENKCTRYFIVYTGTTHQLENITTGSSTNSLTISSSAFNSLMKLIRPAKLITELKRDVLTSVPDMSGKP